MSDSITKWHQRLANKKEDFWVAEGERMALGVFHDAAKRVPAYKDFLRGQGVNPLKIKTIKDFALLPVMDKANYVSEYSLADRCWDGTLARGSIVSYSSGSSGAPQLWPRFHAQMEESVFFHELFLREQFQIHERPTLLVVCFALGIHIAGVITATAIQGLLNSDYPISLVTPGKNKDDILSILKSLAPNFEQVILFGHPGFLKEIVAAMDEQKYDWSGRQTGMVVSGGGFYEDWRAHVLGIMRSKDASSVISLYGCTDMGAIAHETSWSIAVRRGLGKLAEGHPLAAQGESPFIFQYLPTHRHIESIGNELVFTAMSGAPLIRYNLHDRGKIHSAESVRKFMPDSAPKLRWNLPFIFLAGRPGTVIVNGANVYNEQIQRFLEHPKCLSRLTGRFVASVEYQNQFSEEFVIRLELKAGQTASPEFKAWCEKNAVSSLMEYNKEYADCVRAMGEKVYPRLIFCENNDKVFRQSAVGKKKL